MALQELFHVSRQVANLLKYINKFCFWGLLGLVNLQNAKGYASVQAGNFANCKIISMHLLKAGLFGPERGFAVEGGRANLQRRGGGDRIVVVCEKCCFNRIAFYIDQWTYLCNAGGQIANR